MSSGANATGVPAADFQALAVLLHHLARSSRYGVQLRHSGQVDQRGAREAKRAGSLSPITTEECFLNDVPCATISAPIARSRYATASPATTPLVVLTISCGSWDPKQW